MLIGSEYKVPNRYLPYTYRIFCIPTREYYYGVRYAQTCHPDEFWITYFTSSKTVHRLIEEYGTHAFIFEIRRTFISQSAAIKWEHRVNQYTVKWDTYLNKCAYPAFDLSVEERKLAGAKGAATVMKNKLGIHGRSKEEMHTHGKRMHMECKGIHSLTKEERVENSRKAGLAGGKIGGNKARDLGVGIHALTPDERTLIAEKSNKTNKQNKTGIYGISPEQRTLTGLKCRDEKFGFHSLTTARRVEIGKELFDKKLGVHGRSPDEMREHGIKGGNSSLSQKHGFHSDESRKKQSVIARMPWWNDGLTEMKAEESPGPLWSLGRITNRGTKWWNNGTQTKMCVTPPDNTWTQGRIKWKKEQ